jgi:tRNA-2-methylthio-N6-dimethylallyladenosine synthase
MPTLSVGRCFGAPWLSTAAKPEAAALVGIVACSVRQRAADRILGFVKSLRRQNPQVKVLLTGCVLLADRKKLITVIDYFLEIKDLAKLPKLLRPSQSLIFSRDYLEILPLYQSKFSAYVPIMTGCNNFCSYCAVPYTRGREVSRPASKVIKEVKDLIQAGYKEITLVGRMLILIALAITILLNC